MSITVSTLCNANEALSAILNKPGSFHVAIVEVITFLKPYVIEFFSFIFFFNMTRICGK
jgi:hypothetical protein